MTDREPVNIMGVIAFPEPDKSKRRIRFIDAEYNTLFYIPDGASIVIKRMDGSSVIRPCTYIDDCHTLIGSEVYHICEFAEVAQRTGTVYEPLDPKQLPADAGCYEIYQIDNVGKVDYAFMRYEHAKGKLRAAHYAEIKALASGNPLIKEKMDLDIEVTKLKLLKSSHLSQRYSMEDAISKTFPKSIAETQERLAGYGADIAAVKAHTAPNADGFSPMTLAGKVYTEKKAAGAELLAMCQNMLTPEPTQVGSYRGLTLELSFDSFSQEYRLAMIGQLRHVVTLGTDVFGNIQRMDNLLESLPLKEQACREKLSDLHNQLETAKVEVLKPFPREEELQTKLARLEELNALLNMDKREPEVVAETEAPDNSQQSPTRKTTELER